MTATTSASRGLRLGQPDHILLGLVAILILIGLQVVFSSTFALALTEHNNVFYYLLRQGMWAVFGAGLLFVCMRIDYHLWIHVSPLLILIALVTLILVLLPSMGVEQYGAARWLRLGPLPPAQPSEFVKLAAVL